MKRVTTNEKPASRHVSAAPDFLAVLQEFVRDVEAVGVRTVAGEWPDLVVTYRKAVKAIKRARGARP